MKNISFSLTTDQFKARTKTVTRRLGWKTLKPGDILMGCEKCMGLKPGEKIVHLGRIRVVSVRRETLGKILGNPDEVIREGFPHQTPGGFVKMFCLHMRCRPSTTITRIEFEYLDE